MLDKPKIGHPCNGCGVCCIMEPCPIAKDFLGVQEGQCPALERMDGRYWCGLILNASKHVNGLQPWADEIIRDIILSSGGWTGVCDSDDPEPKD